MATDTELLELARAGDSRAFGDLFDRHAAAIHAYALRRLHESALADEVLSATFLEAWRLRDSVIVVDDTLLPWLYGVARNKVRHTWRSRDRHQRVLDRVGNLHTLRVGDHAESVVEKASTSDRLSKTLLALEELDDAARELLTLSVWEGLSYQELAAAMSLPIGTVRSKLSRARAELGRRVDGSGSTGPDVGGDQ